MEIVNLNDRYLECTYELLPTRAAELLECILCDRRNKLEYRNQARRFSTYVIDWYNRSESECIEISKHLSTIRTWLMVRGIEVRMKFRLSPVSCSGNRKINALMVKLATVNGFNRYVCHQPIPHPTMDIFRVYDPLFAWDHAFSMEEDDLVENFIKYTTGSGEGFTLRRNKHGLLTYRQWATRHCGEGQKVYIGL